MPNRQTAKSVVVAERRAAAVKLRLAGNDWQAVADALGYTTRGAACQDVTRALKQAIKDQNANVDEWREQELQHLDALRQRAWDVMEREHLLVQAGRVVRDGQDVDAETGDPVPGTGVQLVDHGPTLAAIDRLLKIQERRAKLLGLDAPTQVAVSGGVRYELVGVDTTQLT